MFISKKRYEELVRENNRLRSENELLKKRDLPAGKSKRTTSAFCVGCKHRIEPIFPLSYGECVLNRTCTDYEEDITNE